MSRPRIDIPRRPCSVDEVVERMPRVRQSVLARFDDCPLSALFEATWGGFTTHPAASGILFHRFAAECLREMKRHDSRGIPVGNALAILEEVLEQRDVPPEERVRLPLREIPKLRMAAVKFANDNEFSIRHVVDVERRITATLTYTDDDGVRREREISGQLDVLVAHPGQPGAAIVIDWKSGWGLPPRRDEDAEDPGLSYHGYFQQRVYAWLVMKNFPAINQVTLREFYVRKAQARPATVRRDQLERIEQDLAVAVRELDRCLAAGRPKRLKTLDDVAPWNPSPGKHCGTCVARRRCPIPPHVREEIAVSSREEASRAAAVLEVVEAIRKSTREAIRGWVEEHGPVPTKMSKGRRVIGLRTPKTGGRPQLTFFTPEGGDRAPVRQPEDKPLEDALRRAAEHAKRDKAA